MNCVHVNYIIGKNRQLHVFDASDNSNDYFIVDIDPDEILQKL